MFEPPVSDVLLTERRGEHVLLVTLNRPEVLNAMNMEMSIAMHELLTRLHYDADWVRCVVLTGAGRAFSAGGDLKVRNTQTVRDWTIQHEISERSVELRMESPVPWIAAVNGICYAGGLEAALTCDFIYADEGARFAQTECKIGIMPGNMGTQNLPRAVGERRAKELILSAQPFTAAEAHEWGMVNKLCALGTVVDEALSTAEKIADCAPLSVRQAKKAIHIGLQTDLHSAYRYELEAYYPLLKTEDRKEGIAAFNEKRKANFQGR
jgi:enoyl-CoA hydratase/carnithine racemase